MCWQVSHNHRFNFPFYETALSGFKAVFPNMTNKSAEAAKNSYLYKMALMLPCIKYV